MPAEYERVIDWPVTTGDDANLREELPDESETLARRAWRVTATLWHDAGGGLPHTHASVTHYAGKAHQSLPHLGLCSTSSDSLPLSCSSRTMGLQLHRLLIDFVANSSSPVFYSLWALKAGLCSSSRLKAGPQSATARRSSRSGESACLACLASTVIL